MRQRRPQGRLFYGSPSGREGEAVSSPAPLHARAPRQGSALEEEAIIALPTVEMIFAAAAGDDVISRRADDDVVAHRAGDGQTRRQRGSVDVLEPADIDAVADRLVGPREVDG